MSTQAQPRLTPEQYLEIERAAEFRSEYYDGRMYAMSAGSYPHARIIRNLTMTLHIAFGSSPYEAIPVHLRVRVSPGRHYAYPDVVVICGEPRFADHQKDTLLNPKIAIEVLSPSTEAYDRGLKSALYRSMESLEEYALVSQSEPRVEIFRRQPDSRWLLSEFVGLNGTCRFESAPCTIPLADVYEEVPFGPDQPASPVPA